MRFKKISHTASFFCTTDLQNGFFLTHCADKDEAVVNRKRRNWLFRMMVLWSDLLHEHLLISLVPPLCFLLFDRLCYQNWD